MLHELQHLACREADHTEPAVLYAGHGLGHNILMDDLMLEQLVKSVVELTVDDIGAQGTACTHAWAITQLSRLTCLSLHFAAGGTHQIRKGPGCWTSLQRLRAESLADFSAQPEIMLTHASDLLSLTALALRNMQASKSVLSSLPSLAMLRMHSVCTDLSSLPVSLTELEIDSVLLNGTTALGLLTGLDFLSCVHVVFGPPLWHISESIEMPSAERAFFDGFTSSLKCLPRLVYLTLHDIHLPSLTGAHISSLTRLTHLKLSKLHMQQPFQYPASLCCLKELMLMGITLSGTEGWQLPPSLQHLFLMDNMLDCMPSFQAAELQNLGFWCIVQQSDSFQLTSTLDVGSWPRLKFLFIKQAAGHQWSPASKTVIANAEQQAASLGYPLIIDCEVNSFGNAVSDSSMDGDASADEGAGGTDNEDNDDAYRSDDADANDNADLS